MLINVNGILISKDDIETLKKYNINIYNYNNVRELQLAIDYILEEEEIDELDYLSSRLQEQHYYKDTNK